MSYPLKRQKQGCNTRMSDQLERHAINIQVEYATTVSTGAQAIRVIRFMSENNKYYIKVQVGKVETSGRVAFAI